MVPGLLVVVVVAIAVSVFVAQRRKPADPKPAGESPEPPGGCDAPVHSDASPLFATPGSSEIDRQYRVALRELHPDRAVGAEPSELEWRTQACASLTEARHRGDWSALRTQLEDLARGRR